MRPLRISRLGLRFYVVGLAQIAVIAAGFVAVIVAGRSERHFRPPGAATVAAHLLAHALGDPDALAAELRVIAEQVAVDATVVGPDGEIVASTSEPAPRCTETSPMARPRPMLPPYLRPQGPPEGGPPCASAPLVFPGGRVGHVEVWARGPPPPPALLSKRVVLIVLLVVGVSSLLLTRSITRPLRTIAGAARAFGRGDLAARARIDRQDELGDVAHAFDEMAERVTELLRAEKELLANISHELRTPLARIRVALDIAVEGDAEVARESLADIGADLDELERLISDTLTAARLDLGDGSTHAGVPPLRREVVDVSQLLARAASRFRTAHPDRPLETDVPDELPAVHGDPVLLRRVIDNLLENAHKYSERPADPVELVARAGSEVEIDVVDRGIGIAESDLPSVFRPFFRADRSRTRATGGLGLGLALAKRIVDAHGGTIALSSRPGEGTRATVRLPRVAAPREPTDGETPARR